MSQGVSVHRPRGSLLDAVLRRRKGLDRQLEAANRARDDRAWRRAAELYLSILEQHGERGDLWVQCGHCRKEDGDLDGALKAYRRAVDLLRYDSDAHLQLGHALKLRGDREGARDAYLRAHVLDPEAAYPRLELLDLDWPPRLLIARRRSAPTEGRPTEAAAMPGHPAVLFDVTDLLHHYLHARLPTGIQRVQISMIIGLLAAPQPGVSVVCFSAHLDFWVEVPPAFFRQLAELALAGGATDDPAWLDRRVDLQILLRSGRPARFPTGATLVNLGTSWWLRNYFLMIREAKRRYGIRYVPFVHDLIPVIAPEHHVDGLVRDFVAWILGVFRHADGFLVNSRSTAQDLRRVAGLLGYPPPLPAVIRLDGTDGTQAKEGAGDDDRVVRRIGIEGPYVLFVSTLESRKNHALAFAVWQALVARRGERRTPILVCVGSRGWRIAEALSRLDSSPALQRKVQILSKVSDADLAALYRNCLFTIYPSQYEGWGLPITESLSHGKVALTTRVSAMPEAGGDWAEYFDLESADDFADKLERLIDDHAYRQSREQQIRDGFRPRSWAEIARTLVAAVASGDASASAARRDETAALPPPLLPPVLPEGRLVRLEACRYTTIAKGLLDSEIYRSGASWAAPEAWGVRMRTSVASLEFRLPDPAVSDWRLDVGLRGRPESEPTSYEVEIDGRGSLARGTVAADADVWISLACPASAGADDKVRVVLRCPRDAGLASVEALDSRVPTLGVVGLRLCRAQDSAMQVFTQSI